MDMFCIIYSLLKLSFISSTVLSTRIDTKNLKFSWRLEGSVRSSVHGLSINDCWKACKERTFCKSVNYQRRFHTCDLNTDTVDEVASISLTRTNGWVYYHNHDEEKCSDTMNAAIESCGVKECPPLTVQHGKVIGNMLTVGSKVVLVCNEGFMTSSGVNVPEVSECSPVGRFTITIDCFPVTCIKIAESGDKFPDAYKSYDAGSGQVVDLFCDYVPGSNLGYTFLSKATLHHVTSLSNHYSVLDHVSIRHYKTDGNEQYSSKITVLSRYQVQYPNVSVFLNENPAFNPPKYQGPYLYMGFIPVSFGDHRATPQGYACDGQDNEFDNCDNNPNNYFVIYEDRDDSIPKSGCCAAGQNGIAIKWKTCETLVESSRNMPEGFFYDTYEIHMGGCGVLAESNVKNVGGITFGIPFEV